MTNEKCYLTGKFARVALGTRYIDYNGRFCMSSAAGGFLRTFGVDRGSTLPWTDIDETDCLFIAGSNTAECHPTSMFRVWNVQERGGYIIVADPRETPVARRRSEERRVGKECRYRWSQERYKGKGGRESD